MSHKHTAAILFLIKFHQRATMLNGVYLNCITSKICATIFHKENVECKERRSVSSLREPARAKFMRRLHEVADLYETMFRGISSPFAPAKGEFPRGGSIGILVCLFIPPPRHRRRKKIAPTGRLVLAFWKLFNYNVSCRQRGQGLPHHCDTVSPSAFCTRSTM